MSNKYIHPCEINSVPRKKKRKKKIIDILKCVLIKVVCPFLVPYKQVSLHL